MSTFDPDDLDPLGAQSSGRLEQLLVLGGHRITHQADDLHIVDADSGIAHAAEHLPAHACVAEHGVNDVCRRSWCEA